MGGISPRTEEEERSILPALRQQPSSSTKPPSLSAGSVYRRITKVERRTGISRSKVPSHWSGLRMNTASPTILRTRHKFGDYLSQPDLAKLELPKKMSRPWIVNNAFEQEKLKDLIVTESPVEASLVMRQIKESKQERKKQPGYNKKHVRNINDIIEKDQKMVKEIKTKQSTKEHVEKKRKHMLKKQVGVGSAATQDDATAALSNNVVGEDHVAGNKEDTPPVETDVELEQQRMMNRVFNCPNLYSAAGPFTTVVHMVPVMVPNHQTGGYFVVHLPVQPLPENVVQPQHVFHPEPSDSPFSSSSTSSSTCSSPSPPASDDGFVDGSDLESESGSLVEMVDDIKLVEIVDDIKLDLSLDSSMELTDEESDYEILDEDLERVVRSIIDEDDE